MDERSRRIEKAFEVPMLVAALLVIPVVVIEQSDVSDTWKPIASVLNWAIWIAFATELVVMLTVVPNRWWWLKHHLLEVAIVVLTPPFMPASLQSARVLRLLRLLRLLRAVSLARRIFSLEGLRWAAVLAVATLLGGGAAFAAAEGKEVSTWDGVWWAMTTMTTVGYGEIYPQTNLGRVIAMGVMVVGIGFIAILTAAIAERFLTTQIREEAADVEIEVEAAEATLLAELRAVTARLHELETQIERQAKRSAPG